MATIDPEITRLATMGGGAYPLAGVSTPGRAYVLTSAGDPAGTSPTAGGDVDLVEGGPVTWFRPGPEQVDTGGSFSAGDDLETDGSGRAVQASSGTVVARALEGSSGAGDTAWVVLV